MSLLYIAISLICHWIVSQGCQWVQQGSYGYPVGKCLKRCSYRDQYTGLNVSESFKFVCQGIITAKRYQYTTWNCTGSPIITEVGYPNAIECADYKADEECDIAIRSGSCPDATYPKCYEWETVYLAECMNGYDDITSQYSCKNNEIGQLKKYYYYNCEGDPIEYTPSPTSFGDTLYPTSSPIECSGQCITKSANNKEENDSYLLEQFGIIGGSILGGVCVLCVCCCLCLRIRQEQQQQNNVVVVSQRQAKPAGFLAIFYVTPKTHQEETEMEATGPQAIEANNDEDVGMELPPEYEVAIAAGKKDKETYS